MIYLIKCSKTKSCKIGFTNKEPLKRLGALQTGNPYELELITTINGEQDLEKELHLKFNHLKLKGEWFQYNQEIKDYFKVDDFMLIYTELWNIIMQKTLSKSDIELAAYLIQNYSEGTPFSINNYIKTIVSKKSNKNETTYNNSTRALVKAGLICKISNGVYIINPKYAYKGSSKDRHKAIIELRDNCKNC